MFSAVECLFLYVEASLRVGSGEKADDIDLPLQREVATGFPLVPASSLKGTLRSRAVRQQATPDWLRLLGSAAESDDKEPSWIVVSDALPLLFPVRALNGLFAWVTSAAVWARFQRDLTEAGGKLPMVPPLPALTAASASVAPGSPFLSSKKNLVLEEVCFAAQEVPEVAAIGAWLAEHAFPDEPAFDYWRRRAATGVVVLPEAGYRHFVEHATQVVPRIKIDRRTGTAAEGSLWSEEYLPPETLLYALVGVEKPDQQKAPPPIAEADALNWVKGLALGVLQMGSGKTLGHGLVRARWTGKKVVAARKRKTTKKTPKSESEA